MNAKLLKSKANSSLKDQPRDVVKLHDEIDTLKKNLSKFVEGFENLNKFLKYNINTHDKFEHDYRERNMFMMSP